MQDETPIDFQMIFPALMGQYVILDPSFTILKGSDVFLRAHKHKEFMIGSNFLEVFPGIKELKQSLQKLIMEGIVDQVDIPLAKKVLRFTNKPILDNNFKIKYILVQIEDITELNKNINLKNEFISVVSHELRTPLTSIQGSLSLLLGGISGTLPPKAHRLLEIASTNTTRLIHLINDILDIERLESGKTEFHFHPVHIDQIIHKAMTEIESYAQKYDIKIQVDIKTQAMVNVDKYRLLQAINNLLTNAVKYSFKGSIVQVNVVLQQNDIKIEVRNNGVGIAKDFHEFIFQKFSQSNSSSTRESGGTGLGLNITKQIVSRFNGKVGFTSEENKETIFWIELPVYNEVISPKQVFGEVPTFLVCEDDFDCARYLQTFLETQHCKVLVTCNAAETKTIIKQHHVDALLLDLILPDQDGISLIKELKTKPSGVDFPIIVISVKAEKGKQELKGSSFSVLDWFEKPVNESKLIKHIDQIKNNIQTSKPKILHIEDDTSLVEIVADLLCEEAIITNVRSKENAIEEFNKYQYDLIILDLLLEDGIATELLPLISQKHTPVIVFSAYDLPVDYSQYVVKSLVKSRASTREFFEVIKLTLGKKKIEEKDYVK